MNSFNNSLENTPNKLILLILEIETNDGVINKKLILK